MPSPNEDNHPSVITAASEELDEIKRQLHELMLRTADDEEEEHYEEEEIEIVENHPVVQKPSKADIIKQSQDIDSKLMAIRNTVQKRLSPVKSRPPPVRKAVATSTGLFKSNSAIISKEATQQQDPEKQRLRFMVIKLQKEYQNSRNRERKAIEIAKVFSKQVESNQVTINSLKRKYLERERQVVEMREMIDELNGVLQRTHLQNQGEVSTRSLVEKISNNYETILESITSKAELLKIIEEQKEEMKHQSKLIKDLYQNKD